MRKKLLVAGTALFLVFTIVSCDFLKDLLDEMDDKRDDDQTGDTFLIDEQGGNITKDNFVVHIPEGIYDGENEIIITVSTDSLFEDAIVTDVISIEGIPIDYSTPPQIKIGGISGDDYVAFLKEDVWVKSTNEIAPGFCSVNSQKVNDTLIIQLPEADQLKSATSELAEGDFFSVSVFAMAGYRIEMSKNNHFKIHYPAVAINDIPDLDDYLEEAYNTFQNAPYSFSYAGRTSWPVEVFVKNMGDETFGEMRSSVFGTNYTTLVFNSQKMSNKTSLKTTVAHEFFHLVQSLYDLRNRYSRAKIPSDHAWLDEAASVWCEEEFTNTTNFVSDARAGNEFAPFNGIEPEATSWYSVQEKGKNHQDHGYGMSALIKYMVNRYGKGILKSTYEEIKASKKAPAALESSIPDMLSDFYGAFMQEYATGKIYSDLTIQKLISYKTQKLTMNTGSDTLKTLNYEYKDLSSKVFLIETSNLDDNAAFQITTENDFAMMSLFKYNSSNSIQLLSSGYKTLNVSKVKDEATSGYQFLLLVTCDKGIAPFNTSEQINVNVKLTAEEEEEGFKNLTFMFSIPGRMSVINGTYQDTVNTVGTDNVLEDIPLTKIDDSNYTSTFDVELFGNTYEGSLSITLTDQSISSVSIECKTFRTGGFGQEINREYTLSAENIPYNSGSLLYNTYRIWGTGMTDHITGFSFHQSEKWSGGANYITNLLNTIPVETTEYFGPHIEITAKKY